MLCVGVWVYVVVCVCVCEWEEEGRVLMGSEGEVVLVSVSGCVNEYWFVVVSV